MSSAISNSAASGSQHATPSPAPLVRIWSAEETNFRLALKAKQWGVVEEILKSDLAFMTDSLATKTFFKLAKYAQGESICLLLKKRIPSGAEATVVLHHAACNFPYSFKRILETRPQLAVLNPSWALEGAAVIGDPDCFKLIIKTCEAIPKYDIASALESAAERDHWNCVEVIAESGIISEKDASYFLSKKVCSAALIRAASKGHGVVVDFFLDKRTVSAACVAEALRLATRHGHERCVERLRRWNAS